MAFNLVKYKKLLFGKELTLSQTTSFRLFQNWKSLLTANSIKMVDDSLNRVEKHSEKRRRKTFREKEKLLVMSNFSFSQSVF